MARGQPVVRSSAPPLAVGDPADQHRYGDDGQLVHPGSAMSARRTGSAGDVAALIVIAFAVAISGLVWIWGGLAGMIFGRGWPPTAPGELLGVLTRLPAHLASPAAAWPGPERWRLPGSGGFYAALSLLAGGALGGVLAVRRVASAIRPAYGRGGARWAAGGELRQLARVRRSGPQARLVLGSHRGRLLYAEQRHALVAFGP